MTKTTNKNTWRKSRENDEQDGYLGREEEGKGEEEEEDEEEGKEEEDGEEGKGEEE